MKKILFILISLLFIPVVYAESSIEIQSIEMDSKSDDAIELSKPSFEDLDMNLDVSLKKVGDYVKYKVIIKNNSDINYELKNTKTFAERDFVKYTYESKKTKLSANDTLEILVTIEYSKEVAPGSYIQDKYSDSNEAIIELLGISEQVNPKTSTNVIMFIVLFGALIVFVLSVIMMKKRVNIKYIAIVLLFFIGVPMMVKAVNSVKIKLNVRVEIAKTYRAVYEIEYLGYFKEEELEKMNSSTLKSDCYDGGYYYMGEVSEENAYVQCEIDEIIEDEDRYYAGEIVTIPSIDRSVRQIKGDCNAVDDKTVCPDGFVTENIHSEERPIEFEYSKYLMTAYGFTFMSNDLEVMNFRYKNGTRYKPDIINDIKINVYSGLIYTMPRHDVYFGIIPKG